MTKLPSLLLSNGEELPIALISLEAMPERRKNLLDHGILSEWTSNYFPAWDMRDVQLKEAQTHIDYNLFYGNYGSLLSAPQIGCNLSHREVARWLANSKHDLILVLEDDVVPRNSNFLSEVQQVAGRMLEHAQSHASFIVHLGITELAHRLYISRRVRNKKREVMACSPNLFLHSDYRGNVWFAHAYLLSRSAAERITIMEERLISKVDDWSLRKKIGLMDEIFYCQPLIFSQSDSLPSTLEAGRKNVDRSGNKHKSKENVRERHFSRLWSYISSGICGTVTSKFRGISNKFIAWKIYYLP